MKTILTKLFSSPLLWVKKPSGVIRDRKHLNGWKKTCKVCRQSKTLMSELLSSWTRQLQEMSRRKLKVAERLLTGRTTPTAHMFQLGITQRHGCNMCGDKNESYRTLDPWFLTPKDRENMRVKDLISLVANTRTAVILIIKPTRCTNFSNLFLE